MTRIYQLVSGGSEAVVAPTFSTPSLFSADTLQKSIGVNVHSGYSDTSYYDKTRLLAKVQELGITRVRDGIAKNQNGNEIFLRAAISAGINVNLLIGNPDSSYNAYGVGESATFVAALKSSAANTGWAGTFTTLEGPNEWNLRKNSRPQWSSELAQMYGEYQTALNNDPALVDVLLNGPAISGLGDYPNYIDYNQETLNLHPYRGDVRPERVGTSESIDLAISSGKVSTGEKPVLATEMGYHNAIYSTSFRGVSEAVHAHYIIRELFWDKSQGLFAMYIYQLFDQKPDNSAKDDKEAWFGIYAVEGNPASAKETWTLRRKLPGDAIMRLTAALADSGTGTLPTTLPFKVNTKPGNALVYPMARKDGTYQIGLVMSNELWDTTNKVALTESTGTVTLEFTAASTVDSSRPSVDATVTRLGTDITTLTVPVDGKLTLLKVS